MALSPEKLAEIQRNVAAAKAKLAAAQQPAVEPPAAEPPAAEPPAAEQPAAEPPAAEQPTEGCPPGIDPKIFAGLPENVRAQVRKNLINPPEAPAGLQASVEKSAQVSAGQVPDEEKPKAGRPRKTPTPAAVDLAPVIAAVQAIQPVDMAPVLEALEANRVQAERAADALEGILSAIAALSA